MKTRFLLGFAMAVAVAAFTVPASASWFDVLTKPVAYEEIPAPAAVDVQVGPHGTSVMVQPPAAPHAPAPPIPYAESVPYEVHAPIVTPAPVHHHAHVCCKQPRVIYRNHPVLAMLLHKCKTGHATKIILEVPTGCCPAEVAVCVPMSCTTCLPKLSQRTDILGRCIFQYCWPCGTKINILKRHTGDLVVHSYEL